MTVRLAPRSRHVHEDKWDEEDLARRLCHALDIAKQAVERLGPNGYADPVEPSNSVRPEKLISETAVLLVAASAADHVENVRVRIQNVAQLLVPMLGANAFFCGLPGAGARVGLRSGAYLPHKTGPSRSSLRCTASAKRLFEGPRWRERPPHRMLEQDWIREIWNDSGSPPHRPSARQRR